MKKVIKRTLCILAILLFAFAYAHIAKTHKIYDGNIDPSEYGNIVESNPIVLEQRFVMQDKYLDGIRIKGVENNDISQVFIKYSLREADSDKKVAEGEVNAKKSLKNRFYELPFDIIENCKGKEYILTIEQHSKDEESFVCFSFEKKVEPNTELLLNNNKIEGTLIVKTITNRFDVETFFVVILFVFYMIFFIRLLYKLFK